MKKILILLFVLGGYISLSAAIGWDTYGKFGTGLWRMKSYRFYDDTIIHKDNVGNPIDTLYHQKDPFPVSVGDFLAIGTFGLKAELDRFKGVVELGIHYNAYDTRADKQDEEQYYYKKFNTAPYFKKWYLEWYLNDYLSVLAGQDFAPTCFFPSNQRFYGYNSFNNVGCLYTGRNPMIQFSAGNQLGIEEPTGFTWKAKAAFVKVDTTNLLIKNKSYEGLNGDTIYYYCEVRVPKIEGSFECNLESGNFGFECKIAGGYQRYYQLGIHQDCYEDSLCIWFDNGSEKYPVHAFLLGGDFRVKLGMFKLAVNLFGGQNVGTYGAYIGDAFGWWFESWYMFTLMPIFTDEEPMEEFLNSTIFEIATILSFTPNDIVTLQGGVGTVQGTHEEEIYVERWNPTYAWYFQAEFTILEKLKIVPEFGQWYYGPLFGFGKYTYGGLGTWIEF